MVICREHFNRKYGRCFEVAPRADGYCERHHFEAFKREIRRRRLCGLCRDCGRERVDRWAGEARCPYCRWRRNQKRQGKAAPKREARHDARRRREFDRRNLGSIPYPAALLSLPMGGKRREFVMYYVFDGNGERAALSAGYGAESAKHGGRAAAVRACKLLRDPTIRAAIEGQRRIFETEAPTRHIVRGDDGRFIPTKYAAPGFNTYQVPLVRSFS